MTMLSRNKVLTLLGRRPTTAWQGLSTPYFFPQQTRCPQHLGLVCLDQPRRMYAKTTTCTASNSSYHQKVRQEVYHRHKDYYKILGISPRATSDEVKDAFRQLAKKYHPDVGSAEADPGLFKVIAEAYSVLGDSEKRRQYDTQFSGPETSSKDRETIRQKNEQFSESFGTKFKPSSAGKYTRDTSAESAYTGAMQGALNRMRDDAYVRGRMNRQFRHRVYVPTKNESYISLFYLPMYAFGVVVALWFLYKYVARSRAVASKKMDYRPQKPPSEQDRQNYLERTKQAARELEEKKQRENQNASQWRAEQKARL